MKNCVGEGRKLASSRVTSSLALAAGILAAVVSSLSSSEFTRICAIRGFFSLSGSVQQLIPIASLARFIAQVADQPLHVRHAHPKCRACLRHDILLYHDAAEIVRAELQRDLPDLLALRNPRTLDIREIIEINPGKRLRAQIFVSADSRRAQFRVLGLKRPADECGESFRFVLLRAEALQMFDPILD